MSHLRRGHVFPALASVLLVLAVLPSLPAAAKGSLSRVESEFEKAIQRVTPATVVCLPWGVDRRKYIGNGSSGVIMSRKGLVLSDGDVGIYVDLPKGKKFDPKKHLKWATEVEIRLPSLKGKGFQSFKAAVLKRDRDLDTTLMRIEDPKGRLKYLKPGDSDELQVGDFGFAVGNSFGLAAEAPPTLTAGVVASLVPKAGDAGGRWSYIYTSAAVNPGVNGGPFVDVHGRLVGTISNVVSLGARGKKPDDPELAYAYLGKVIPVARLKHHYADMDEYEELFGEGGGSDPRDGECAVLSTVFHHTGRRAHQGVVSLEIQRKGQMSLAEPAGRGTVQIPRYLGPVSGVLVSKDGYVLTSLYNLANIATLVNAGWAQRAPENAKVKAGLDAIEKIQAHLPDGRAVPAKLVARHEGIGVALLKAEVEGGTTAVAAIAPLEPARAEDLRAGRFALVVGNPFGAKRLDDPLLTVGVLSKQHAASTASPWASQWQTDAGITDANCGGAAVDLKGHLLGITTIWSSTMHGRNSGIGFIVPWTQIEPVLGELKRGRSFQRPFFGITWKRLGSDFTTVLDTVMEGEAAHAAGLKPGDEIVEIDGESVAHPDDVRKALRGKWSGDTLLLKIRRAGEEKQLELVLGARD